MRQIAKYILVFFIFFSCSEKNSDEDISIKESQTSKIQFFVLGDWGFHGSTGQMKVKYAMNKLASSITLN